MTYLWQPRKLDFVLLRCQAGTMKAEQIIVNRCISLNSLILAFPPFGDHPPGSLFHQTKCVSYLKVICAHSCEHIEAFGDLFSPKLGSVTPLFLIQVEKNHPVVFITTK